jgi:hypothetical protein
MSCATARLQNILQLRSLQTSTASFIVTFANCTSSFPTPEHFYMPQIPFKIQARNCRPNRKTQGRLAHQQKKQLTMLTRGAGRLYAKVVEMDYNTSTRELRQCQLVTDPHLEHATSISVNAYVKTYKTTFSSSRQYVCTQRVQHLLVSKSYRKEIE